MGAIKHSLQTLDIFKSSHLTPYKVYVRRDRKLAVCLNPKVGSTTFRETLVEGLEMIGEKPLRGPLWPMNKIRRYTTAPLYDYLDAFNKQERYEFHCFVRNPYARVLSAWNDKLVKGFHAAEYPRSMKKLIPRLREFAQKNKIEGADESKPFPFSSFIRYIESQKEGQRNQHWDTQCSVLCTDKIDYRHYHKMETDFVSGMIAILGQLGIDESWIQSSLNKPRNASGEIKETVYDQILAERVYRIYEKDFKQFNYEQNSWKCL